METIRINELTEEDSIQFLISRNISKEKAQKTIQITGGLFKYLTFSTKEYQNGLELKTIQEKIEKKLEEDYKKSISISTEAVVLKGVKTLLDSGSYSLSDKEFRDSVFGAENDPKYEKLYQLMKGNVFSLHDSKVKFQNRAMLRYLKNKSI